MFQERFYSKSTTQYRQAEDWNQVSYFFFTVHAKKPNKIWCKLWVLPEALTGFVSTFKSTLENVTIKRTMVRRTELLWIWYLYKNHNLHFDNYYNSPKILKDGVSKNNYACGTIHVNRVVFPDDFKDTKLAPEEALFIQEGNVMATHLKDKRDVFIISLIHDNKFNDVLRRRGDTILKPKMIMKYNKFMDGVDKCD